MPPNNHHHAGASHKAAAAASGSSVEILRDLQPQARAGAAAAGPSCVTHIHGAWYELGPWLASHPGGPVALSLAAGRDATILFEQSHPFTPRAHLQALLAPFRVAPEVAADLHARHPRVAQEAACFTFSQGAAAAAPPPALPPRRATAAAAAGAAAAAAPVPDAFEAEVKALVRGHFEAEAARRGVSLREATKAPPERWASVVALAVAFVALGAAPLVAGRWWALVTAPVLCWLFMVNFWHDASHFAMSTAWQVNWALLYCAPWFSSPLVWWHQHVIGHHAYTNVPGQDPDLYHAPAVWRFSEDVRWRAPHAWQAWSTLFLWALSVPTLLLLKPLAMLRKGSLNRVVPLMPLSTARIAAHLLGRLVVLYSLYIWPFVAFPHSVGKALIFGTVPISIYSLLFMACSQVNHHSEETSGAGAQASPAAPINWYRHQAATSHTIAPQSSFAFWASGGLNLQLEHHLFPCINHWHLPRLAPLIEAAALRHGVPYPKSLGVREAFGKLFEHIGAMAVRPSKRAA